MSLPIVVCSSLIAPTVVVLCAVPSEPTAPTSAITSRKPADKSVAVRPVRVILPISASCSLIAATTSVAVVFNVAPLIVPAKVAFAPSNVTAVVEPD